MTEAELRLIEERLGYSLPEEYNSTVLNYPFAADSFANEFMLLDNVDAVVELNEAGVEIGDVERPFFVGSDGGEEWFFIDASKEESPVFVFQLESGKHHIRAGTWGGYLEEIRTAHAEIEADEEAARQRKLTKQWWEFWK